MTSGFTVWEGAFLFSTTSEHCCFIQLAALIQAVHSPLPEENNLVCVYFFFFVCFMHFELIIIWLQLLALLSMFSFRLSRVDDFCRWFWLCRWYSKDTKRSASALVTWTDGAAQRNNNEFCFEHHVFAVLWGINATVHAGGGEEKL